MAQQHSMDIVSKVDAQEVDNAVNMANKEIKQRYDLRDTNSSIEFNKKEMFLMMHSKDEFPLKSSVDILLNKLVKRSVSLKALKYNEIEPAASGEVKQKILLQSGIDKDKARMITKMIKDSKLKVSATIQDEQVRVSGKIIDDLQTVIQMIRDADLDFPTQFVNYK